MTRVPCMLTGSSAVALLGQVCLLASHALTNGDNIAKLVARAADILDVIISLHADALEEPDAKGYTFAPKAGSKAGGQGYNGLMSRLEDLLTEIKAYCDVFRTRMFIVRMLTSGGDQQQFDDMAQRLAQLTMDATFAVSVDTHGIVVDMQATLESIQATLQYKVKEER